MKPLNDLSFYAFLKYFEYFFGAPFSKRQMPPKG
jgi:hypothetical protein